jgi:hypothetical protein
MRTLLLYFLLILTSCAQKPSLQEYHDAIKFVDELKTKWIDARGHYFVKQRKIIGELAHTYALNSKNSIDPKIGQPRIYKIYEGVKYSIEELPIELQVEFQMIQNGIKIYNQKHKEFISDYRMEDSDAFRQVGDECLLSEEFSDLVQAETRLEIAEKTLKELEARMK